MQQGDPLAPLLFSVGLHTIIDSPEDIAGLLQLWYLDDGVFKGSANAIAQHLARLQPKLASIGLRINKTKCEIYAAAGTSQFPGLEAVPVIAERDAWTYLGTPLCEQSGQALQSVRTRISQATTSIVRFADPHPAQALQLLRATSGACKVEFLIQSLSPSPLVRDLATYCATELRKGFAAVLKTHTVDDATWITATLPLRMGGLGLRDPTVITASARLASMVNVSDRATAFGAIPSYVAKELDLATVHYMSALNMDVRPQLKPSADLQRLLTDPLHQRALDLAVRSADEPTLLRLNSLSTPHATTWTVSSPLVTPLTPVEFRAALRWTLGLPFRTSDYPCPDCGRPADSHGVHAITCSRSGMIARGHTSLRDTVQEILRMVGLAVEAEQSPPGQPERPADLLISSWRGKPLAIDFTVITPTRPSASHMSSSTTLMDKAAELKIKKSHDICAAAGWTFLPFVADTFGAIRSDARALVSKIIKKFGTRSLLRSEADAGAAIWSAITSAVMARVAMQLGRLSLLGQPLGMSVNGLDFYTSRGPTAHSISGTPPSLLWPLQARAQTPQHSLAWRNHLWMKMS